MEKQQTFEYQNFNFVISIKTNVRSIKGVSFNGGLASGLGTWHELRINDLGQSPFYHREEIEDADLESALERFKQKARDFANGRSNKTEQEKRLERLGFN